MIIFKFSNSNKTPASKQQQPKTDTGEGWGGAHTLKCELAVIKSLCNGSGNKQRACNELIMKGLPYRHDSGKQYRRNQKTSFLWER